MHCRLENGAGTDDPLDTPYVINTNPFVRSLSSENVPLCVCVIQIRVCNAVSCRMASTQFAD